jgi:hypothetical protein
LCITFRQRAGGCFSSAGFLTWIPGALNSL